MESLEITITRELADISSEMAALTGNKQVSADFSKGALFVFDRIASITKKYI